MGGGGGGGMLPDVFFCSLFPVQQTTNGIGHRVKYQVVFRVGNQYAEFEKQQQQQQHTKKVDFTVDEGKEWLNPSREKN